MKVPRLTLKLEPEGHYVDFNTFADAVTSFRRMLNGLRDVTPDLKRLHWLVTDLHIGSAVAAVEPVGDLHVGVFAATTVMDGLRALESEGVPPPAFSQEAIAGAKSLAEALSRGDVRASIAGLDRRLEVTSKTAARANALLDVVVWEDLGTVEGSLEMVNVHERFKCNVYDHVGGRRVECHFRKDQLDAVRESLGGRVQVCGLVRYNRFGQMLTMRADQFLPLPSDSELPTIDDITGIDPDFSGGLSTEEHIRRLRDE